MVELGYCSNCLHVIYIVITGYPFNHHYVFKFKGWMSNFEEKYSKFKSCYKWHNYLALNNMHYDSMRKLL